MLLTGLINGGKYNGGTCYVDTIRLTGGIFHGKITSCGKELFPQAVELLGISAVFGENSTFGFADYDSIVMELTPHEKTELRKHLKSGRFLKVLNEL